MPHTLHGTLAAWALFSGLLAEDHPRTDPRQGAKGAVCEWQATDGLKYEYYVPAGYTPEVGANLTLVLHGTGLDHRWTFLNHPPGEFRPDDIVVSPDGTSYRENTKANEFLGETPDATRVHDLVEELQQIWKINQVFVYGHSNGSFFAFYYAARYPDDVDGVCGHSSGVWSHTTLGTKSHRQAIALMHGTADGVVPYGQSWWGRTSYRDADYPMVHLRTLFDWDHRPHWHQAQLQLAWCEGLTSEDPARIETCLRALGQADVPKGNDWGALWAVANRLCSLKTATDAQRELAISVAAKVDALAASHVAHITESLGKGGVARLKSLADASAASDGADCAFVGHVLHFVEDFDGVPAREAWCKANHRVLEALQEKGEKLYVDYLRERTESIDEALEVGLDLLDVGWTHYSVKGVASQVERWMQDPKRHLSKSEAKRCDALLTAYRSGRAAGFTAYEQLNSEVQPLE